MKSSASEPGLSLMGLLALNEFSVIISNIGVVDITEIRKLTANVEAVLLGVIIPLCQRNSGRLEEADREVQRYCLFGITCLAGI